MLTYLCDTHLCVIERQRDKNTIIVHNKQSSRRPCVYACLCNADVGALGVEQGEGASETANCQPDCQASLTIDALCLNDEEHARLCSARIQIKHSSKLICSL